MWFPKGRRMWEWRLVRLLSPCTVQQKASFGLSGLYLYLLGANLSSLMSNQVSRWYRLMSRRTGSVTASMPYQSRRVCSSTPHF